MVQAWINSLGYYWDIQWYASIWSVSFINGIITNKQTSWLWRGEKIKVANLKHLAEEKGWHSFQMDQWSQQHRQRCLPSKVSKTRRDFCFTWRLGDLAVLFQRKQWWMAFDESFAKIWLLISTFERCMMLPEYFWEDRHLVRFVGEKIDEICRSHHVR